MHNGTRLGPYEILATLGAGGMGEVYLARDTRLGRDVAIKVLPEPLAEDPERRLRFEREARTISQLQHPNICALYDIGSENGVDFLVMEHLEGETLERRLEAGALDIPDVLDIGTQIATAIGAAHEKSIVHRDLKPGNIMLTRAGVKVLDFGLARKSVEASRGPDDPTATAAITEEGKIVGTVPYMAPEQLQGKSAESRTDIWALGCILYEMATGVRAFRGESQADLIGAIMAAAPQAASSLRSLSPKQLDGLVSRCLEKQASKRWQSAGELGAELEELAQSVMPGKGAWLRRPVGPLLGATALMMAVILLFGLSRGFRLGSHPADNFDPFGNDSVAVLPFDNVTTSEELESLALGLWDELLGRVSGFGEPVARQALLSATGKQPCEVARDTGARWIYTGSLTAAGERVRVEASLWDCPDQVRLWRDTYDRPLGDNLALQHELVGRIRETSQEAIDQSRYTGREGTVGWQLGRRTPEGNARALETIYEKIAEDPTSLDAPRVLLSLTHLQALIHGWADHEVAVREMVDAADDCMGVQPRASECQYLAGWAHMYGGDSERMLAAFQRLLEMENEPDDFYMLGQAQTLSGNIDEGIENLERAIELSPKDPSIAGWIRALATGHLFSGRVEEALDLAQRCLDYNQLGPWNTMGQCHQVKAVCLVYLGDWSQAESALVRALELTPDLTLESASWSLATSPRQQRDYFLNGLRIAGLASADSVAETTGTGVAVLPFDNLAEESDLEQVALGIPEDLHTSAAAVVQGDFQVVAPRREAAASFSDPCEAAETLGVEFVITGSVRAIGDQVRITSQLFDCPGNDALWSESWDGHRNNLLEFQDEVARAIGAETDQITNYDGFSERPGSPRWHIGRRTRFDNAIAVSQLREAGFENHLEAELQALTEGWVESPQELLAEMREVGDERRAQAPRDWGSHYYRGDAAFLSGERELAVSSTRRALELAGGIPLVQGTLARVLATAGQTSEAIKLLEDVKRASPRDPMMVHWLNYVAIAHFADGNWEQAIEASLESLSLNYNTPWNATANSHQMLAATYALVGDIEAAKSHLTKAKGLRPELSPEWAEIFFSVADAEVRQRYSRGLRVAGLSG